MDPEEGIQTGPLCFASRGFSLHAATRIAGPDSAGLERLCRYVMRPPLAAGRLRVMDGDCLSFALKTPWRDGTTHLVLSPTELIEKLAALIPPPHLNLVRYHGVFAPNAADRAQIVPRPEADAEGSDRVPAGSPPRRPCRLSWAQLLSRVFQLDVTVCPACGGRLRIIAALTEPPSVRCYLEGVGLPARPPPIAPARRHPQTELEYAAG